MDLSRHWLRIEVSSPNVNTNVNIDLVGCCGTMMGDVISCGYMDYILLLWKVVMNFRNGL